MKHHHILLGACLIFTGCTNSALESKPEIKNAPSVPDPKKNSLHSNTTSGTVFSSFLADPVFFVKAEQSFADQISGLQGVSVDPNGFGRSVGFGTGRSGYGMSFPTSPTNNNGDRAYVEYPDGAVFRNNSFTLSFWMRIDTTVITNTGMPSLVFGHSATGATGFFGSILRAWDAANKGKWYFQFRTQKAGAGNTFLANFNIGDQNWHHFVVTVKNYQPEWVTISVFVDGVKAPIWGSTNTTLNSILSYESGAKMHFGSRTGNFSIHTPFRGEMDEFALFNSAFNDCDAIYLYRKYME